MQTLEDIVR